MEETQDHLRRNEKLCEIRKRQVPPGPGLYCNAIWDGIMCWDFTHAGTAGKQACPDFIDGFYSAGFATRECLSNGIWKTNAFNRTGGWTNYTDCFRSQEFHQAQDDLLDLKADLNRIQLISDIGYGVSLAFLIVAVTIMIAFKRLHCKSNVLHINLFLAFILRASVSLIKTLVFVNGVGLEKDIIRYPDGIIAFRTEGLHWELKVLMRIFMYALAASIMTISMEALYLCFCSRIRSHWECKLLMSIFMYSLAASMMWISMEALYLFMLMYRTLFTSRHGTRMYVFIGWLSPLVFVIPWICVRIFMENDLCWNRHANKGYFWILKAPIQFSIIVNFILFICIVRGLCAKPKISRHVQNEAQHLRKTAKFVLVLIPLFGIIYIIFSAYPTDVFSMEADIKYIYCEMLYNSFQGFILALLLCFLNEEVQNEVRRCCGGLNNRSILILPWRSRQPSTGTSNVI